MGKKYTPSGYQIINIDVSARTSGTGFVPETDDEKLLYEILLSSEIKKPILLNIITNSITVSGFVTRSMSNIALTHGILGAQTSESIEISNDKLVWVETEE